ncbi:hypothetical protein AgCh_036825 [Apium graveolens]
MTNTGFGRPLLTIVFAAICVSDDGRSGTFAIGNDRFPASLLDLPAIVESYKTYDDNVLIKTADIGQMIMVREEGDSAPDAVDYRHGLTPPMRDARRRRFRREPDLNPELVKRIDKDLCEMKNGGTSEIADILALLDHFIFVYSYMVVKIYLIRKLVLLQGRKTPNSNALTSIWFRDVAVLLYSHCLFAIFFDKASASHVEVAEHDGSVRNTNKKAAPALAQVGNAEERERSDSDESG